MFLASCLVSLHLWEEPSFGLYITIFRKRKEESGYCLAFSSPPSLLCHVLKAQTILLALHWTPSSLSVLLLELCTSIMTCNSRGWPSTSFTFQEFFKNSCFISCMFAGSHDVAVQKFDSTENLVGSRCTRTSPACNPLSSYLFLLPYSRPRTLPMICVHVTATRVGAQVRVSMDVSCQPLEQEMACTVCRCICDHYWLSSWAGWKVE